jgi:UDP-2-acetamido-3-amino-2,3-dideoxy-glucuronate N-acetyltransferase
MLQNHLSVIGVGYWGKNLVRNFAQLGALHSICDANAELLKQCQTAHNVELAYSDYKEVLANPSVKAVAIAAPAVVHYEIAKAALLAGKDVFVEKPLALNVTEAEELIVLARDRQRILMVDHILQYHPAIIKLKDLIYSGVLGKLQYVYSNRLNIGKLRSEENILWSFAPHDISVILSLVEEHPQKVEAFGEDYLQEKVYDTTMTMMSFSNRLRAHIFVSWLHPYKEQKLVVVGDKKMAVFNDIEEDKKLILYSHKVQWVHRVPIASRGDFEVVPLEKKEPLNEACQHFLDCVASRTQPRTDGKEALAVLKVLNEAQNELDRRHSV